MTRQSPMNRTMYDDSFKGMKFVALFVAMVAVLPLAAADLNKSRQDLYADKAFYFATWGGPGSGSVDEQMARMQQFADAGITDILPGAGA